MIAEPEAAEGTPEAKLPFHGPNQWPVAVPSFKPAMKSYMAYMSNVHQK